MLSLPRRPWCPTQSTPLLSELGVRQTRAVGRWLGEIPEPKSPTVILASPYQRARQTAIIARETARLGHVPIIYDERLREREFGVLENLTLRGLRHKFPDQAQFRSFLGKFYHRPPGGESWCDVILRLRNAWDSIGQEYANERVLVVCHSVVVLCFRYFLEHLTEEQIIEIDRENEVANCSVTFYEFDPALGIRGDMALRLFNFVAPIEAAGERVTRRKDVVFGAPDEEVFRDSSRAS